MPLLRKKPFVPIDLPPDLKADEEVFLNVLTKEIFRDYEEYFKRSILCKSLVWSCEYTGRSSLTLQEALESEHEAAEHLQKMPFSLQQGIVCILHKHQIASLNTFVEQVLGFYRNRFLIGEEVEIAGKSAPKNAGTIVGIQVSHVTGEYKTPADILYLCNVAESQISVKGNKICRKKNMLTRERVKLLVKCSAKKTSTDPPLYSVKEEHVERLELDNENLRIPYLSDYGKTPPPVNRRPRAEEDTVPQKKKKAKKSECSDSNESKVTVEERRRLQELERARKRREKQQERDHLKKLAVAEQNFHREWQRPREDLELTDSKELPVAPTVDTALPISLFGDMVMVAEFFYLFGEHVDLAEEFPGGIQISKLEEALIAQEHTGLFGDIVIFLLKLVFALQLEEDEEEHKFATKYNFTHVEPVLDTSVVTMEPCVTWKHAVQSSPDLPFLGAAQAYFYTHFYWGTALTKLQLDAYTITEILRLHVLGAGGRNNGQAYYGRWRHNCRGMFTDADDPCVELRNNDPSLVNMLSISNIYDLPPASKLTVLSTLVTEILTYAQFREIIEEAWEGARDAKKQWKGFENDRAKRKKEESANKYKEWVASRIKIKEAKKQKKKGRVSDLASCDTTLDSDSDVNRSYEADISQLVAENGQPEQTDVHANKAEETPDRTAEDDAQEFHLYTIFREISCKLKVKPLGQDRYYRKYWAFNCVPGVFVEGSTVEIRALYPEHVTQPGEEICSVSSSQSNKPPVTPHINGNCLPIPGDSHTTVSIKREVDDLTTPDITSIIDTSTMTVEQIVQLKLREAESRSGPPPITYKQLRHTPGYGLLRSEQAPCWAHYSTEPLIGQLMRRLNPRGDREKDLLDNLNKDKLRISQVLEELPLLRRYDPEQEEDEERQVLKRTSAEKLMEAYLRELICDLENRIFEASFGKVKNRMAWRQEIEDFWLDDSVKYKKSNDVPTIPQSIVNQRLETLRCSQPGSQHSTDTDSLTSGSGTVVSRRSIITELKAALSAVERGVPAKYLSSPLGKPRSGGKSHTPPDNNTELQRWRESLAACTSLSQITLHLLVLDSSVTWNKSILKANCRVCKRRRDPDKLLLCDKCDRGEHIYCLKPKLKTVPQGRWFCSTCKPRKPRSKRTKPTIVVSSSEEDEEVEEEEEEETEESGNSTPRTLADKLKACRKIHELLIESEDGWPFMYPVDSTLIPDYYRIIPNPADLTTIRSKLRSNKYSSVGAYVKDVQQIFLNCKHYNTSRAPVYRAGTRLGNLFSGKLQEYGLQ